MKSTKCKSGLTGWKAHLQKNYSSFEEFERFDNLYGISLRIGFNTAREAWEANPIVEGSVNPDDFRLSETIDSILDRLDEFTKGYIECALWSSSDTEHDLESLDGFGFDDIDREFLAEMEADSKKFQEENQDLLKRAYAINPHKSASHAGHDFWLTRNGHGTGYWDRGLGEVGEQLSEACQGHECHLYVGDNGKIYHE